MKQLNDIIASPLAELINKSFQSAIFESANTIIFFTANLMKAFKQRPI